MPLLDEIVPPLITVQAISVRVVLTTTISINPSSMRICVPRETSLGSPEKADVNKFVRADHVTRGQCKALPWLQFNLRLRKFADADLRPLCVGQQRNGKPQFLPDTLDRFHTGTFCSSCV